MSINNPRQIVTVQTANRFIRWIAWLTILAQAFAVPALYASHPDVTKDEPAMAADCPAHEVHTEVLAMPEDCECSGGLCCDGIGKRSPAVATAGHDFFLPEVQRTSSVGSPIAVLSSRNFTSAQSRAPPLHIV